MFVYADIDSRLLRCRQKAPADEHLSDAEMKRKILGIDKDRDRYYKFITNQKWGEKQLHPLCQHF
jgi:hypothetical protein